MNKTTQTDPNIGKPTPSQTLLSATEEIWREFRRNFTCKKCEGKFCSDISLEYVQSWISQHFILKKDAIKKLEKEKMTKDSYPLNPMLGSRERELEHKAYNQALDKAIKIIEEL